MQRRLGNYIASEYAAELIYDRIKPANADSILPSAPVSNSNPASALSSAEGEAPRKKKRRKKKKRPAQEGEQPNDTNIGA